MAIEQKRNRDGHQQNGDASEQRAGPLDAHAGEHLAGEEGKAGGGDGAQEAVAGNGGGGAGEARIQRLALGTNVGGALIGCEQGMGGGEKRHTT